MWNLPKMSGRAARALEVLADGGRFYRQLEWNYRGHEKWCYRLKDDAGREIRGIGMAAFYELDHLGLLALKASYSGASVYGIRKEGAF